MSAPALCLPTVYLNGEFLPIEQAKISPLDRGFIFGDGVYEVIPYYAGRGLRAVEHLKRLQRSLDELDITNPYSMEKWQSVISTLIEKNGGGNIAVYIQVTRGVAKRDFPPPAGLTQTVFLMANTLSTPKPEIYENGITCVSLDDNRWLRCHIKATALLGAALDLPQGPVFLDLPDRWDGLAARLRGRGFAVQRPFVRMALGERPMQAANDQLFVLAGPEFG